MKVQRAAEPWADSTASRRTYCRSPEGGSNGTTAGKVEHDEIREKERRGMVVLSPWGVKGKDIGNSGEKAVSSFSRDGIQSR
jgi:hypothetical protein